MILKQDAGPAAGALNMAARDKSGAVATLAAESLYGLDDKDAAAEAYIQILQDTVTYDMTDRNFALNSVDAININSKELTDAIEKLYNEQSSKFSGFSRYSYYDVLMSEYLLKKWGADQRFK